MNKPKWNKTSYSELPIEENFFTAFANMNEALNIQEVPVDQIRANPNQPRTIFDQEKLEELSASIKEHGVFTPIIVTENDISGYDIVAGERRYRASILAEKATIPAIIRTFDELQRQEVALLENIQREQLNAMEEAIAYNVLMQNYDLTQEQLSLRVGKSRSHIANMLRLNNLDKRVQLMLSSGELTMSQARTVLSETNLDKQHVFAQEIKEKGLTTRQTEAKVSKTKKVKDYEIELIEEMLRKKIGCKVDITGGFKKGKIVIKYDQESFNEILKTFEVEL